MNSTALPRVAFVGLGHMGGHMCRNVITAGFEVTAYDLDPEAVARAVADGAHPARGVADCARHAELLITSLPGPAQVDEVLCGTGGAIAAMSAGALVVEMSTSSLEVGRRAQAAAAASGIQLIDAPVAGQTVGALPVLEAIGNPQRIFHLGAAGCGYAVKLLLNLLWFIQAVATAEALTIGVRAGVDLSRLHAALVASPANSVFLEHDMLPLLERGDYDEGFVMKLVTKDLGLAVDLARDVGVPVELSSLVEQINRRARATYGDAAGEMSAVRLYEDLAGAQLRWRT
jgi:3-hydroxyisobutyrate dehydrogenase